MKAPITDVGKVSMPGKLFVEEVNNIPYTHPEEAFGLTNNILQTVWDNGPVKLNNSFDLAKERLNEQWIRRPKQADVISKPLRAKITEVKLSIFDRYKK